VYKASMCAGSRQCLLAGAPRDISVHS